MGMGDELIASGAARKLHKQNRVPVLIVGLDGRPRWSPLWEGLPYIVRRAAGRPVMRMVNGPHARPYIAAKTPHKWTWKPYRPQAAEIVFTPEELAFAEPFRGKIMIEPNVKANGHANKAWLPTRWAELSRTRDDFVQCVSSPEQSLPAHVLKVHTPTFRHALAVLSVARAFVGTEGGLHHGAAAVGTPAVVLFGGFIAPAVTGYSTHRNLFTGTGLGCGARINCEHCRKAMAAITVERVVQELQAALESSEQRKPHAA